MVSRPLHPLVGAISHRFARGTNDAAPSTAADWHIASGLTQCPQTRLLLPVDVGRLADAPLGADFRNPAHERLLRVRTVMAFVVFRLLSSVPSRRFTIIRYELSRGL